PTIKWQRFDGVTWADITATMDGSIYTNYTTNTLNLTGPTTAITGYQYRSVFNNINGSSSPSTAATLTVTPSPSATISYPTSPFGSTDPATYSPSFSGTAGGTYSSTAGLTITSAGVI